MHPPHPTPPPSPLPHVWLYFNCNQQPRILETSHRSGSWTYYLLLPRRQRRNPTTVLPLQQPRRVFTKMLSDLCGLFKPCGKEFEVCFFFNKKEKPLNMMSWTGSSTKCDCLIWCSPWMEMLHTFLLLGGEKGHEGECYLYKPKYYLTQGSVLSWSKGRDVLVIYQKVDCNFQRKC